MTFCPGHKYYEEIGSMSKEIEVKQTAGMGHFRGAVSARIQPDAGHILRICCLVTAPTPVNRYNLYYFQLYMVKSHLRKWPVICS